MTPAASRIIVTANVSRRHFLGGLLSTGAFVVAARFVPDALLAQTSSFKSAADSAALNPSVYLGIDPDGTVHIVTHRSEMGTGIRMGIVAARSFTSYIASVVEVQVDGQGRVRIPRVIQVVDAGTVVNPDRVRAQFEGAAVMGIGLAMTGEISAEGGRVVQTNFHTFQVPRINDAPVQVDVHIVESDAPPGGVGEPGLPPIIPALTNAIFAATGKRVRELPISKTNLVSRA